ncbi:hypothetical protein [Kitasatospora brasiliensis]|uniref:hypothetical protein n=1 Tax=Kitasatospora brasiliensis TaxID=3058040 RepID=UPI002931304D|nr:hypothetical protein [Kitasatospora sp. K002]
MSLHRENVTWQREDGTWSIGFYKFTEPWEYGGDDPDDYDHEWDVEYDHGAFWYLSTGHPTWEAAGDEYTKTEPNPGGTTIMRWECPEHREEIARLDAIAAEHPARLAAEARAREAEFAAIIAQWK